MLDGMITKGEVWDILKRADIPKAAGSDGIHSTVVKLLAELLVKHLNRLLNATLNKGRLPAVCLTSTVISVHKGADRDNRVSSRSVSQASTELENYEGIFVTG